MGTIRTGNEGRLTSSVQLAPGELPQSLHFSTQGTNAQSNTIGSLNTSLLEPFEKWHLCLGA